MHPQMLNPYVYCNNNPVKFIDPNGLEPIHPDYNSAGEKFLHFIGKEGNFRFNNAGALVEHTGKVIGKPTGAAARMLKTLLNKYPNFFKVASGASIILMVFTDAAKANEIDEKQMLKNMSHSNSKSTGKLDKKTDSETQGGSNTQNTTQGGQQHEAPIMTNTEIDFSINCGDITEEQGQQIKQDQEKRSEQIQDDINRGRF